MTTAPTQGHPPIVIEVIADTDGFTYQLTPQSRLQIRRSYPDAKPATRVFIGHDTLTDFEQLRGSSSSQVVALLTGLSFERLGELGEVLFRDPINHKSMTVTL